MPQQEKQIIYLYRITCIVNQKVYIGQTVQPSKRWYQHRSSAADPTVPISYAIRKYGNENFSFEVIAGCQNQNDANELETILVTQYESHVSTGKGYNATHGGMNAPKSEEWKQAMRDWHRSLSPEAKEKRNNRHREAMFNQIATKGHPARGRIVTEEERKLHSKARLENPLEYTEELRQKMSVAHIGIKDTEETKRRKSQSIKESWYKRNEERFASGEIKCNAPGCEVNGKHHYMFVGGIRYCNKHGQRLRRTGFLELQPRSSHNKGKRTPEETLQKLRGRVPHNKIVFTEEQVTSILSDNRSNKRIAKDFGVTEKVIIRIKREHQK